MSRKTRTEALIQEKSVPHDFLEKIRRYKEIDTFTIFNKYSNVEPVYDDEDEDSS